MTVSGPVPSSYADYVEILNALEERGIAAGTNYGAPLVRPGAPLMRYGLVELKSAVLAAARSSVELSNVRDRPVRGEITPGDIKSLLPATQTFNVEDDALNLPDLPADWAFEADPDALERFGTFLELCKNILRRTRYYIASNSYFAHCTELSLSGTTSIQDGSWGWNRNMIEYHHQNALDHILAWRSESLRWTRYSDLRVVNPTGLAANAFFVVDGPANSREYEREEYFSIPERVGEATYYYNLTDTHYEEYVWTQQGLKLSRERDKACTPSAFTVTETTCTWMPDGSASLSDTRSETYQSESTMSLNPNPEGTITYESLGGFDSFNLGFPRRGRSTPRQIPAFSELRMINPTDSAPGPEQNGNAISVKRNFYLKVIPILDFGPFFHHLKPS